MGPSVKFVSHINGPFSTKNNLGTFFIGKRPNQGEFDKIAAFLQKQILCPSLIWLKLHDDDDILLMEGCMPTTGTLKDWETKIEELRTDERKPIMVYISIPACRLVLHCYTCLRVLTAVESNKTSNLLSLKISKLWISKNNKKFWPLLIGIGKYFTAFRNLQNR